MGKPAIRYSDLFTKTSMAAPQEENSANARLLVRAGYVSRVMAGVYAYLPLGKRVLDKIEAIIHDEMQAIGGHELLLPGLHPQENWKATGRWDKFDVLFKTHGEDGPEYALGPTHEEVIVPVVKSFVQSYRDLPFYTYQIQTKFRNELRPKSGLLRGREFRMKDLYSFHATQDDLDAYYEKALQAYINVFERCGIGSVTVPTIASGGTFSEWSHEFQTETAAGEDTVYYSAAKQMAVNDEVKDKVLAQEDWANETLETRKTIEVGNIFKLGTKFAEDFGVKFQDSDGNSIHPVIGCYGIGTTRLLGAIAEVCHDENGLIWPESIAPFDVHVAQVGKGDELAAFTETVLAQLKALDLDVLLDDGPGSFGSKMKDADLIGIPVRIVIGSRAVKANAVEVKRRTDKDAEMIALDALADYFRAG
ncbi:proline--tRNA ligase [Algimonas porphyrae]|uniref:Proline--tRNA ligase n=1 Tax=Algimonas porphyrae TaxID=1128113 RepID=A0ABQ5V2V1_9PROT|nr:aminoacyl--tRNA ligase-related protein [Algimonas porphyrae]GLQ21402.1 proline--tRNA ligase [Algimonas porphyrae]